MYLWECACYDCGHEFEATDILPPFECKECGSEALRCVFIGREYDW